MTLLLAVSVTRRFYYLTFTVRGCYLLAVSVTRHFLLLAITQRFHYPSFQLLDVSAPPTFFAHRLISLYHNHK